jgi:hypothetical protein
MTAYNVTITTVQTEYQLHSSNLCTLKQIVFNSSTGEFEARVAPTVYVFSSYLNGLAAIFATFNATLT